MVREKQLPTPPPDGRNSEYALNGTRTTQQHNKAPSQNSLGRRGLSTSSIGSTGAKRTAYGSGYGTTNGMSMVDVNDDLSIRLLAQNAMGEIQTGQILTQEQVDDLKNVTIS